MDDRFILKSTKEEYFTICEYWSSDLKTIHAEKNDNTKNITAQQLKALPISRKYQITLPSSVQETITLFWKDKPQKQRFYLVDFLVQHNLGT